MTLARLLVPAAAAAAAATIACSDSTDPKDVTLADLVGTWDALEFVFTSKADASKTFDAIAAGASVQIDVRADGMLIFTQSFFGTVETDTSTVAVANGVITIDDPSESHPAYFDFTLSGDRLSMMLRAGDVGFDFTPFDQVDDEEPADLDMVFERQ